MSKSLSSTLSKRSQAAEGDCSIISWLDLSMRFSRLPKQPFMHKSMAESGGGRSHKAVENYFSSSVEYSCLSESIVASLKLSAMKKTVEFSGIDGLLDHSTLLPDKALATIKQRRSFCVAPDCTRLTLFIGDYLKKLPNKEVALKFTASYLLFCAYVATPLGCNYMTIWFLLDVCKDCP